MKKTTFLILFIISVIIINAQNERWDDLFVTANAPNGNVMDIEKIGNDIYVCGNFTTAGGITVNNIAKWDGSSWSALGSGTDGTVFAMAKWNNKLYIGGSFSTVNGVSASNIAVWDGTGWSALGTGTDGSVLELMTKGDYEVYAGGSFTNAGGVMANRIALWDGTSWNSLGSGMNGSVNALEAWDTLIIAGGSFSSAGGNIANNLAYWDGTNWDELGGGTNGIVYTIYSKTDSLLIGGNFSLVNTSITANNLAVWDGSSWSTLGSGTDDVVYDFIEDQTLLYMTGGFSTVNGSIAANIASWDGANWSALGDGLQDNGFALLELNRDIYVGGLFTHAGMKLSDNFARWGALAEITAQPNSINACDGDSVLLHVQINSNSGTSCQWQLNGVDIPGKTNDTIVINPLNVSNEGNYTCVITNYFGDIATDTAIVNMISAPSVTTISVTPMVICAGQSISFQVATTGESINLQWFHNGSPIIGGTSNNYDIVVADILDAGDYYCVATNICGSDTSDTLTLNVNALPVVSFAGLDTIYCNTDLNDTLIGLPSGGIFSGNGISGNIFNPYSLLGYHMITYMYTDTNGCTNSYSEQAEVIAGPVVSFSGFESSYCHNSEQDTLTGSPYGGTFSGLGMNDSIFNPAYSGFGSITISYTLIHSSGCILAAHETINIYAPANAAFIGLDTVYCPNNPTDTFSVIPYGGLISGAITDTIFNPNSIGAGIHEIYYTFTDNNSCLSTDTFTVIVSNNLAIDLGNDTSICAGEIISANSGYTQYLWSTGDTTNNIIVSQSGNYQITVTDTYACQGTDNVNVTVLATPYINLGPDLSITADQTTILGAGGNYNSYLWNTGATTNFIVIDGSTLGIGQHEYWVIAGESSGCTATDTILINVGFGLFVEDKKFNDLIKIYPCPADKILTIDKGSLTEPLKIELININGQIILEKISEEKVLVLDIEKIQTGIYTLRIGNYETFTTKSLIIK